MWTQNLRFQAPSENEPRIRSGVQTQIFRRSVQTPLKDGKSIVWFRYIPVLLYKTISLTYLENSVHNDITFKSE